MNFIDELVVDLGIVILERLTANPIDNSYRGKYKDQIVHLRRFNDLYYTDRFLREGLALRQLKSDDMISIPKIIEEWPEYSIRAVEWVNFTNPTKNFDINQIFDWLTVQSTSLPHTLKADLTAHLNDINGLHPAYDTFFENIVDNHINCIPWNDSSSSLLHGDLHLGNIGHLGDNHIILDWEFATQGNPNYDRAYFDVFHGRNSNQDPSWVLLATLTITHWYLQEKYFSPKLALDWVGKLAEVAKTC